MEMSLTPPPGSPSVPPSGSTTKHTTHDSQGPSSDLDPFALEESEEHVLPLSISPNRTTDSDTPPFPTAPRLNAWSPRNYSTISSLAGSRDLGRPALDTVSSALAASPTASVAYSAATTGSIQPYLSKSASELYAMQTNADDVAFLAEPQGLMQMLSLVGSTFFEADREGYTEDDARDAHNSEQAGDLLLPHEHEHEQEPGTRATLDDCASQRVNLGIQSRDRTAKDRLYALARDDLSDDGSTPQGSRSPLDGSVITIGPGTARQKRASLSQSELIPSRDSIPARGFKKPSNLRSQLHTATSASAASSRSGLNDNDKDQEVGSHKHPDSPMDSDPKKVQNPLRRNQSIYQDEQTEDRSSDQHLIRPFLDRRPPTGLKENQADSDHDRLLQQLKEVFQLDTAETLLLAQPCWLFRSLLLQGHLYLTSSHVCFYAYLPSRDEKTIKTGMLGKRTRRTHRFSKHWASLKGGKLSWFDNDRDPYFPQGHIDLRKVSAIEPSNNHKDRFKVTTPARKFTFLTGDESSRDTWIAALQKQTFRAQNQGESVRISIPLETIMNVETTLSVDSTEMVCITVVDEAGDFSVDEYYFLHLTKPSAFVSGLNSLLDQAGKGSVPSLHGGEQGLSFSKLSIRDSTGASHALLASRKSLDEVPTLPKVRVAQLVEAVEPKFFQAAPSQTEAQDAENADSEHTKEDVLATAIAVPTSKRRGSKDVSTDAVLSTTPRATLLNRLSMDSSHTYPPSPSISDPPGSFDQVQKEAERGWAIPDWLKQAPARVLGRGSESSSADTRARAPTSGASSRRRRKVLEMWSDDKNVDDVSRGESNHTDTEDEMLSHSIYSTQSTYSMLDAEEEAVVHGDHINIAAEFRDTFGIGEDEGLVGHTHAYLYRVLPVAGRFFVAEHHLAFRSSGIAAKAVGRTLMLVPLQDVISAAKHVAFRPGHHGMVIIISGHEELFIEISSAHRRDELLSLIEHQLELGKEGRGSRASREAATSERSKALVLRDLSETINEGLATDSMTSSAESSSLSQSGSRMGSRSGMLSQMGEGSSLLSFAPTTPLTFTMLTIGSRGDVQPYIALAKGLQADGHRVRIATHAEFGDWILGHGIDFSEIGGDPAELMRICVENGTFTVSFLREGVTKFRDWLDELLASAWRACQGSDVIVECPSAIAGIHVAEALQVPYFRAFTMPWTRTRAYPHAFAVPNKKAGGNYNYMSYVIFDQMFWRASSFQINRWRKNLLGLKPTNFDKLEQHKVPFIYNFSPSLVPRPLDWFEWIHVTGFWFLDNPDNSSSKKWKPPSDLEAFIRRARETNRKLVYIGWGSIVVPDAEAMTRCVLQAVQKSGVCAILSKGWSDRLSDPAKASAAQTSREDVFQVTSVPHDWLFPQIDAACHHGGAGTLGASLRAGLPTVVKPYFGDQFFWGQQIESLGVGSCVRQLTADNLAAALVMATTNAKQIERARKLGEQIRGEDGVANAVKAIYRDLDYARSRVKTDTRIVTPGVVADHMESAGEAKREVEEEEEEEEEGGSISDEWSDIGASGRLDGAGV